MIPATVGTSLHRHAGLVLRLFTHVIMVRVTKFGQRTGGTRAKTMMNVHNGHALVACFAVEVTSGEKAQWRYIELQSQGRLQDFRRKGTSCSCNHGDCAADDREWGQSLRGSFSLSQ